MEGETGSGHGHGVTNESGHSRFRFANGHEEILGRGKRDGQTQPFLDARVPTDLATWGQVTLGIDMQIENVYSFNKNDSSPH